MFEVKLKTKGIVKIDLYQLTVTEIRALLDKKQKDHEGDVILAKAVGMTVEELTSLPFPDYRKLTRSFWQFVADPLKDEDEEKNSQSESTST